LLHVGGGIGDLLVRMSMTFDGEFEFIEIDDTEEKSKLDLNARLLRLVRFRIGIRLCVCLRLCWFESNSFPSRFESMIRVVSFVSFSFF